MSELLRSITLHVDTVQGSSLPGAGLLEVFERIEMLAFLGRKKDGIELMVHLTLHAGKSIDDLREDHPVDDVQIHAIQGTEAVASMLFNGPLMALFSMNAGCWLSTPTYLSASRGIHMTVSGTSNAVRQYRQQVAKIVPGELKMRISRLLPHGDSRTTPELSTRRREVLRMAYHMGYYTTPRACTQRDIAVKLGIKQATVAEHLQRGELDVIRHVLMIEEA